MSSCFKGVSNVVSVALITGFIVTSVTIVFLWASPLLDKSVKIAELERMKSKMSDIDDAIRLVSHSGVNSSRSVFVSVSKGKLLLSNSSVVYVVDVGEAMLKDGVSVQERNMWITGRGTSVELKLNYSGIQLAANDIVMGDRNIVITKIGASGGKPVVGVVAS
ncbi:MAG: hypothetical protein QXO69_00150 [archaeon]